MLNVAEGALPAHLREMVVVAVAAASEAGSTEPNASVALAVLNLHWLLESTVAVTATLVDAAKTAPAIVARPQSARSRAGPVIADADLFTPGAWAPQCEDKLLQERLML